MIRLAALLFALACAGTLSDAPAQDYPSRPIKLVLPQPAGGGVDTIARTLGERLSEQLKQPVIIENKPGANGGLAARDVARSAPDGYTLFVAVDTNLVVNPTLYPNLAYEPFRDFAPISVLVKSMMVLVSTPKLPADNVRALIAHAKANPGKINYASIGLGTQLHLGIELFKTMTNTDINRVEYRGTSGAVTDLIAGQVEMMLISPPFAKSMSEAGQLNILAVTGKQRHPLLPHVPTIDESGVPGYEMAVWFGILAPAKTPKPVLDRLTEEVRKVVADPRFRDRMNKLGLEAVGSSPEEMHKLMQSDTAMWADVIKATGVKIE